MWTYRCSPVAALGQDPSHSLSGWGAAGFWFRSPADHPRAEVGCKNPFPGRIPLREWNARGMTKSLLMSMQGRACTFSLISCLLCLSLPCKSLGLVELSALIFGNKAFFLAYIRTREAKGKEKGKQLFSMQRSVMELQGCNVNDLAPQWTFSIPIALDTFDAQSSR